MSTLTGLDQLASFFTASGLAAVAEPEGVLHVASPISVKLHKTVYHRYEEYTTGWGYSLGAADDEARAVGRLVFLLRVQGDGTRDSVALRCAVREGRNSCLTISEGPLVQVLKGASLMAHSQCVMCTGADASVRSPLQQLLPQGQSRFIAETPRLVAVPTFGCFVAGYVLIVPRAHVLSFGRLAPQTLAEAGELISSLAGRIEKAYRSPVLGFEYGNNQPGSRRIEHAHWHLLPSAADLSGWLDARFAGRRVESLAELPSRTDHSYIAVRSQCAQLSVYPVPTDGISTWRYLCARSRHNATCRGDVLATPRP
jgi:diadenosine tetraphosphate (Ap4A) HIT family hydrolase